MTTVMSYLDAYCERAGDPAMFAEPLNAVTNLFFIVAAVMVGKSLWQSQHVAWAQADLWGLVAAMFSIGIGSGLWHMFPSGTTVLMDVIPITLFIHIYLVATLRRVLKLSWNITVFWWMAYFGMSIAAQYAVSPNLLHGSILYIPTYFTLMLLAIAVILKDRAAGLVYFRMLGLWTISLVCRTVDLDICTEFEWGTHFLWHTFNAYMLYRLSMLMIRRNLPEPAVTVS